MSTPKIRIRGLKKAFGDKQVLDGVDLDVMPGTGGFRKMRWADPERGKGRRGGLRVIYYCFETDRQIWLITLYGKNEANDLSPAEKKALKAAIESETRQRAERRSVQRTPHRR